MTSVPAHILNATRAAVLRPARFLELIFDDGPLRLWSGTGVIQADGKTWYGTGALGAIDGIGDSTELEASGLRCQLSAAIPGIRSMLVERASRVRRRPAALYFGVLDVNFRVIGALLLERQGYMDTAKMIEGDQPVAEIMVEDRTRDLWQPRTRYYTDADQQDEYPGDRIFEMVASLQNSNFKWGD